MSKVSTVLVVDDMVSNAHVIEAVLEDDHNILIATSGQEALEIVQEHKEIDLILLDIVMPEMDGFEVCEKLKASTQTQAIPVIFLTAETSEEHEEKGFMSGGVDYIMKPIRPTVLSMRVATHVSLKKAQEALEDMALHDQLTTLYNRHYLEVNGKQKFSYAKRDEQKLTLAMLDIDFFKKVNDTYGHEAGDKVLKAVAEVLKQSMRVEDTVARIGGEEFVIVFKNSAIEAILDKVETIRATIEGLDINGIHVTVSFGLSEISEEVESFEALLKLADKALYKAKNNGRNCIVF